MPTWNTAADWDGATAENGVVHENVTDSDHNDASILKQGYRASNPYYGTDLELYYPFGSNKATDFSGNGYDGSLNGVTETSGILGTNSFNFDGSNDYITVGNKSNINFADEDFSLWAWIKTTDSGKGSIIEKAGGGGGRATGYSFYIENSYLVFRIRDGNDQDRARTSNTYNDGNWHLVGVNRTSGGNSANLEFIVDGQTVSDNDVKSQGANDLSNNFNCYVGAHENLSEDYINAKIEEVRIYSDTLSSAQYTYLYDVVSTNGTLTTDYRSGYD